MSNLNSAFNIDTIEYCFCFNCNSIKEASDLVSTEEGLKCRECGGFNLGEAGWVNCPHQKLSAVKCPRAGKGIVYSGSGIECIDRCYFRT